MRSGDGEVDGEEEQEEEGSGGSEVGALGRRRRRPPTTPRGRMAWGTEGIFCDAGVSSRAVAVISACGVRREKKERRGENVI